MTFRGHYPSSYFFPKKRNEFAENGVCLCSLVIRICSLVIRTLFDSVIYHPCAFLFVPSINYVTYHTLTTFSHLFNVRLLSDDSMFRLEFVIIKSKLLHLLHGTGNVSFVTIQNSKENIWLQLLYLSARGGFFFCVLLLSCICSWCFCCVIVVFISWWAVISGIKCVDGQTTLQLCINLCMLLIKP